MLENYQDYFSLLLSGKPDEAYINMGRAYLQRSDWAKACQSFMQAHRVRRGIPWNELIQRKVNPTLPLTALQQPLQTGLHKLDHDIAQLDYLIQHHYLPETFRSFLQAYQGVRDELAQYPAQYLLYQLTPAQQAKIAMSYDRNIYQEFPPVMTSGAVNPDLDFERIEADYFSHAPGMTHFDHLLTPTALKEVYRFCLTSTIWNDYRKSGGYLGTYMHDGFNCPLLHQIAQELRWRFPRIIQGQPLIQMWAYKCDSEREALETHADAAAVNVNFWVSPDEGNLDPNSGGMVVYDLEAPSDWDFDQYNIHTEQIHQFIREKNSPKVIIPYRQNRVVMFNSNLFHETDEFHFKTDYEYRRINVTMLFGDRVV